MTSQKHEAGSQRSEARSSGFWLLASGFWLLPSVLIAGAVVLGVAQAADQGSGTELGRCVDTFLDHRRALEIEDPAAVSEVESLLTRMEKEPRLALGGRELVRAELVRARLENLLERDMLACAGRPSRLRTGPPPEPSSDASARLARRIERLAGFVFDLLPDEIAAARSDCDAERRCFREDRPVSRALGALAQTLERAPPAPSKAVRDYRRVLRAQAAYPGTIEELVASAEAESRRLGDKMEEVALSCGAASAAALIEHLKEEGEKEDPLVVGREEEARAAKFARDLFTIPDGVQESLVVDEGNPSSRTPFGHYIPIGWRGNTGHYVVTAMKGSDPGSTSRRRESYRLWIRGVSAHEGVPGHHLHFGCAQRSGDAVRTLPFEGATTEGWGLFIEGVLMRAGYFDEPRAARLTPLRLRRWRALRVILDAGLQTGTLTREQAIARLQRDCVFDRTVAEDEVDRYRERAGYYAGYLLGARTFEAEEALALKKGGPAGARALRDRILALGPATPLRAIAVLARDDRVLPP